MPPEEDLKDFKSWAIRLGCPLQNIPDDAALKKLFQSGDGFIFQDIINKVRPFKEVKEIRDNILLNKMKDCKGTLISFSTKHELPTEMQRFLKIERLSKKIQETEKRIEEHKSLYETHQIAIKDKNYKKLQAKNSLKQTENRTATLFGKHIQLQYSIQNETHLHENIKSSMPVQRTETNSSEPIAVKAINSCVHELNDFYLALQKNSHGILIRKDALWKKLREIFLNIPNNILWNTLIQIKENQLYDITTMTNHNLSLKANNIPSAFSIAITKAHAKNISLHIDIASVLNEYKTVERDYLIHYDEYVKLIETNMSLYNIDVDVDPQIINDFIIQDNMNSHFSGQLKYLEKEIEIKQQLVNERNKQLHDHPLLISSLRQIYENIEATYISMREEIEALQLIKDKLKYTQDSMNYLMQNSKRLQIAKNDCGQNQSQIFNSTINSFNSSTDSVLCSTKLDIENTIRFEKPTRLPQLPQHINELLLFLTIPKIRFSPRYSNEIAMNITENTMLGSFLHTQLSQSFKNLLPGHLLTPRAAINEISSKCELYSKLKACMIDVTTDVNLPKVNLKQLHTRISHQIEYMSDIFEEINGISSNINGAIEENEIYYRFLLNNPLRKYIPITKHFNGHTFQEYEQEYNMHYSIIENATNK